MLPTRLLKETAPVISPFLSFIFQQSVDTGTIPNDWRHANITAIHKKGPKTEAVNYRPISLTSVPCKLLEHIIFHQIMSHLDAHSVLVDYQHGFRKNRSCEIQLINAIEDLARSLNNRNQTDMLIQDFSKAFDTVAHNRLLLKLNHYSIRGANLAWMQSWLTSRTQQVLLEGKHSRKIVVRSGVPQGTVLGPLCFLLYINDIGNGICSTLRLFADDTLLYGLVHNNQDAIKLQEDLDNLTAWAQTWQMNFHPSKCYVLRIHRSKEPTIHNYTISGHILQSLDQHPYLGVTITKTLNWKAHVSKIKNKANKTLGFIKRNLHSCPEEIKSHAYTTLVRSLCSLGSVPKIPSQLSGNGPKTCRSFCDQNTRHGRGVCYKSFKPPAVANPRKPKESCQTLPVTQNTAWQSVGFHALLCNSQARPKDKRIPPHEIPHNSE